MSDMKPYPPKIREEQMIRSATWTAVLLSLAGFAFFVFAVSEISWTDWQDYVTVALTILLAVSGLVSIPILQRGNIVLGTGIVFIANLTLPLGAVALLRGPGWAVLIYTITSSSLMIWRALPRTSWRWAMMIGSLVLVLMLILIIFEPFAAFDSPPELVTFIIGVTIILFLLFVIQFAQQMWTSGRLRNKIIIMMIGILTPVLVGSTYFSVQAQRQELEDLLLERAGGIATSGAVTIGLLLEDAIESGVLTYDQVFDRDYVKFWEFDPANDLNYDPEADPDITTFDKYHTAYDAYTDQHWQVLVDSFLIGEDVLFAIPVDINGYLPTHNSRYATGDGSAANDRTKRIFNDPVGIRSARNTEPVLQQVYPRPGTGEILWDVSAPIYVNGEHWGAFRVGIQLGQNQERVIATTWRSVITSGVVLLAVIIFAWVFGNYITVPLEQLTEAATSAAQGDLEQHIDIPERDEITDLAGAFNTMTAQLRETLTRLEQRVADRTRALETSTEVSRRLSTILDQRDLVREVVEQVQQAFDYYHAHIYIFDDLKENLHMVGGTGEAGQTMLERGHQVPRGRGLVGRAADSGLPVVVPNVSEEEDWLPNPLLPETKSEVAVPIAIGENVLGVLDVQDDEVGGLESDDAELLQSIANQVAIALQNARAYRQTQEQIVRESLVTNITQQIQSTTSVEEALKVTVREVGRALGDSISIKLTPMGPNGDEK